MRLVTKLVLLGVALGLMACETTNVTQQARVPLELLQECKETPGPLITNGDLVNKVGTLRVDLANCNADKRGIARWDEEVSKPITLRGRQ